MSLKYVLKFKDKLTIFIMGYKIKYKRNKIKLYNFPNKKLNNLSFNYLKIHKLSIKRMNNKQ
jgi:hypothetical protein